MRLRSQYRDQRRPRRRLDTGGEPLPRAEVPRVRAGGDTGAPIVVDDPQTPAAQALQGLADGIAARGRNLAGRMLGLSPV